MPSDRLGILGCEDGVTPMPVCTPTGGSSRFPRTVMRLHALLALLTVIAMTVGVAIWLYRASVPTWPGIARSLARHYPAVSQISDDVLLSWMRDPRQPPPVVWDVRTPAEFAVSHLPGAIRVDPDAVPAAGAPASGPPSPGQPVAVDAAVPPPGSTLPAVLTARPLVVYCSVGERSSALADRLRRRGVAVVDLSGGIFTWANHGKPLMRKDQLVSVVHPYNQRWGHLLERSRWAWSP